LSEPPPIPCPRADGTRRQPGWRGALRGVWLMTWRSQLTLRRLPGQLGMLLALPLLVYMTMVSTEKWGRRSVSLGEPSQELNTFTRRLAQKQIPLPPNAFESLLGILAEVNAQSESTWHEKDGESAEDRRQRLEDHLAEWNSQILSRAKTVLDDRQYEVFQSLQERTRSNVLRRLTEVSVPWSRTEPFYHWLINFYFYLILPLTCVRGCGPLIRDELQADTLGFLVTRPVGRARLLVVKYLSEIAWLEMVLLLETLLIFAAGASRQIHPLGGLLALVLGVQILAVPAWSALGLLLGQLTTRYMATALLYGAVVEMGLGRIPTNINTLSLMRHIQTLLSHNEVLQGIFAWPAGQTTVALCALVAAPIIFLGISALLFMLVEYHHAAEMQK
jgi:hypothetical protein